MKTWKKAAIGGLMSIISLGYSANCVMNLQDNWQESTTIRNQPKFKKYDKLRDQFFLLRYEFHKEIPPGTFNIPFGLKLMGFPILFAFGGARRNNEKTN
ncbi:hypothetical protein A3K73_04775 [Candidatus Pacearchaeota archaeon RBG_13_36_9]|nr:MAG: hypothetical protein A3K73_04775 [Candidatus Pacearchaeota archaeon RBG_13_36_9]HJX51120.1 hypothetical protein [Candidatus Nanoarchaeia archaeon]